MKIFNIKPCEERDLETLFGLIKEFAQYEKMEDFLECDISKLKNTLLDKKFAKAFILEEDHQAIGYMIYFYTFSSFWGSGGIYLEDIYIKEAFRKKGYGRAVFKFLGEICQKENLKRLEWVCLNDNFLGINFYESLNAEHLTQWRTYRLSGENLKKLCKL